ncbi:MAG TPA: hypothetical protein VJB58_00145 [Candidatus Paceibacterota bacterium]
MQLFGDGESFERALFGEPEEIILELGLSKPRGFTEDVSRIIRHLSRSKTHRRCPKTHVAKAMYLGVKKELALLGVSTSGLRLFSLIGTNADKYYETDALFYLPYCRGYESVVVTIDARWINPELFERLRDYWIESSEGLVYSELNLQGDLFAHSRIFFEHSVKNPECGRWILSREYKALWERGYLPAVPKEMIDRPVMRPENHLTLTQYHLEKPWRRKAFTRLVACELWKQIRINTNGKRLF